jgi:hypothetical protein
LGEVAAQLAAVELIEDPLQYADFSAWQHELSDSGEDEARAARTFWSELGTIASPVLPLTRAGSAAAVLQEIAIDIGDALAGALAEQAGRYGTTPAALAQAAWHAVLGQFSGEELTTVLLLPGERRHPDLEGAIGAFARPVPIQARVGAARAFAEVLSEIDRARSDALVNQDYAPAGGLEGVEIGFESTQRSSPSPRACTSPSSACFAPGRSYASCSCVEPTRIASRCAWHSIQAATPSPQPAASPMGCSGCSKPSRPTRASRRRASSS